MKEQKKRQNRTKKQDTRFTEAEYVEFEKAYAESDYSSKGAFIRAQIFNNRISEARKQHNKALLQLSDLLDQLRPLNNNFNQLMKKIHSGEVSLSKGFDMSDINRLGNGIWLIYRVLDEKKGDGLDYMYSDTF